MGGFDLRTGADFAPADDQAARCAMPAIRWPTLGGIGRSGMPSSLTEDSGGLDDSLQCDKSTGGAFDA